MNRLLRSTVFLGFCLGVANIHADTWEELVERVYSSDVSQREEGIRRLISSGDQSSITILKNRLLAETNRTLRNTIFAFFEKRKDKKDFYHLNLYLKTLKNMEDSQKCVRLLYELNPRRLKFELARSFKEEALRIHLLSFLKAIPRPLPDDVEWLHKAFENYRIAKFWLSLHPRRDTEIIQALTPYYQKGFFQKKITNYTLYWLIRYSDHHKIKYARSLIRKINLQIVESLLPNRQKPFLESVGEQLIRHIQPEEWFGSSSEKVRLWMLKSFFLKSKELKGGKRVKWERALIKRIGHEDDLIFFRVLISFEGSFTRSLRAAMDERCTNEPRSKIVCFSYFLRSEPRKAHREWLGFSDTEKRRASRGNLFRMFSPPVPERAQAFSSKETFRWFLSQKDSRLRYLVISQTPKEKIEQYSALFSAHLKKEINSRVRLALLLRLKFIEKIKK